MIFRQLFDHATWTFTYLLADADTREAVLIDPVVEQVERDLALLDELGLVLRYSLETHVHADHVTASGVLREHTGARTAVSSAAGVDCADIELRHGDSIRVGDLAIAVRHTPGHTDTCVTYVVEDGDRTLAFTGDALLIRGCGRTDFQQGDSRRLYRSVHEQIFSLDGETVVYPGHDYKGRCCSTVAEEKRHNPRLGMGVQEDTFVELMDQLDLAKPRHIERALPANLACGRVVA